jgi:Ca-activated chloride channel homolog
VPARLVVIVPAIGAVAIAVVSSRGDGGQETSPSAQAPPNAVAVTFAYSPEKERLLAPLVREFNRSGAEVAGRPVVVEPEVVASGEAQTRIARERLKPVAWSPASSLWGRLLNFEADRRLVGDRNPSIVRSPLVIAMWEPMARALGWPRRAIGFADLLELARSDAGWAAFGRPEYGRFKLVHTNPDFSTSGLEAVVAEYYAATGKKEGLTERDVTGSRARSVVRSIERSIVHYGDTTLFIADQMRGEGPAYASAVAMEEVTLLDFNRRRGDRDRLVALYPKEGTFFSDKPFMVLEAPWVTAQQAEGARAFQRFLARRVTPAAAAASGFRPADDDTPPVAPVDAAHGADPAQPDRVLALPEPRVLAAIKRAWAEDRKPANILLVLDTSGSMNEENRLENAKQGLMTFFRLVARQDSVGLTTFSDVITPLEPIRPLSRSRARLEEVVGSVVADGGTAFYDAAYEAHAEVQRVADDERINAVVLLTDGHDTDSVRSFEEVVGALRDRSEGEDRVRLFTIAYSAGADEAREELAELAAATGGKSYEGDPDDIEAVYRSISSFF